MMFFITNVSLSCPSLELMCPAHNIINNVILWHFTSFWHNWRYFMHEFMTAEVYWMRFASPTSTNRTKLVWWWSWTWVAPGIGSCPSYPSLELIRPANNIINNAILWHFTSVSSNLGSVLRVPVHVIFHVQLSGFQLYPIHNITSVLCMLFRFN